MNMFDAYSETKSGIMGRARALVTEFFPYILLLVNIMFMVASSLFTIGFKNPFTPEFFINLILNGTASTLSYACFVTYAEHNLKLKPDYTLNCQAWSEISMRIRSGISFDKFLEYCKAQVEREREEKRVMLITNNTRITIAKFEEYKVMPLKDISDLKKNGTITRREYRYLRKALGNIRVKPINPLLLLCGTKVNNINDAGRAEGASTARTIMLKPLTMLISSAIVAGISCAYSGVSDGSALYSMFCSAFLILVSAFMGYSAGVTNVNKCVDAIKSRIIFLDRFEKSQAA